MWAEGPTPAPCRPPRSPGTGHTVGPLGEAPWARAHPQLLTSLSQRPAAQTSVAVTGAPDQSPCYSRKDQLEPEPLGVAQLAKRAQASASPMGLPGSPPVPTASSFPQRWTVCGLHVGVGMDKAVYLLSTRDVRYAHVHIHVGVCICSCDDDYGQVLTLHTLFNLQESCAVLLSSSSPLYR